MKTRELDATTMNTCGCDDGCCQTCHPRTPYDRLCDVLYARACGRVAITKQNEIFDLEVWHGRAGVFVVQRCPKTGGFTVFLPASQTIQIDDTLTAFCDWFDANK